jgi:hypothetical protein
LDIAVLLKLHEEPLNRFQKITGGFSLFLGLFFVFRAIGITAIMSKIDLSIQWPSFVLAIVFIWIKALIPIVLFGNNTMLNNKITARIEQTRKAKIRAQIKSNNQRR